ncbi:MAG: protein-glutamate O-methyltransferase CheR [Pseudomonadota bacterium]
MAPPDTAAEPSAAVAAALIALVRQHTGIAMAEHKSVLLERRLRPRLQALALPGYQQYLERLQSDTAEVTHFIDLVTTNDTLFFRTPALWTYLSEQFLPRWFDSHPGQCLQIWSAAAASGEELYSVAMLCEQFGRLHGAFRYQVLGTDISQQMLELAAAGVYRGRSAARLQREHPALCQAYCEPVPGGIRVRDNLKRHVRFARHNLLQALRPAAQFDLLLLRNVLFYFEAPQQQAALDQLHACLRPGGRLLLGESESIGNRHTGWKLEQPMGYRSDRERS